MSSGEEEVRVLFVEDDPDLAEMYRTKLELDGYVVSVARDGEEAIARASADPPDLVFLDIRLPRMDGIQVLEELRAREQTKHLPVVILSNYSDDEWRERVRELGALEWLIKTTTTPSQVSGQIHDWTRPPVPGEAATRPEDRPSGA